MAPSNRLYATLVMTSFDELYGVKAPDMDMESVDETDNEAEEVKIL